ncbi:hypothetical protein Rhe02_54860 [Rhizocola hellebori]|uniref:DUF4082 domain-containing protein n=1 Tax=Rhizocola hellebori TaxID=1392758 RepID=A0A8J3VHH8_9ACTN|nr:DUF4082 domain-containing protein [Rhizocola hellebori]GIH07419.1 hypothetical protein Rhe02_54860 [Rhizocola hellebori]
MAESIFTNQTPSLTNENDGVPYCLGTVWTSDADGTVTGIRWYFPATLPTSTPTVALYSWDSETTGTLLGSGTFVSPTAGTWNTATLDTPAAITATTKYVAVVRTVNRYVATSNFFTGAVTNGHLTAPADSGGVHNGKYDDLHNAVNTMIYPQQTINKGCYFVDPVVTFSTEYTQSVGGSSTPTGAIAKATSRALAGSSTPTATIARSIARTLSGTATATGAITRQISRLLSGSVTPTGAILKAVSRLLGGSVTPTGAVDSEINVILTGTWHIGRPKTSWHIGRARTSWTLGRPRVGD